MLNVLFPVLLIMVVSATGRFPVWLVGTWTCEQGNKSTTETWTMDNEILHGTSRTERNGQVIFTEALRIQRNVGGELVYVAKPMNQDETIFTEVESRDGFIAFENPDHDFPKRITYTLADGDTLIAEISGDGKSMSWRFKKK